MEALWQDVPVLTVAGDRWAARTTQTLVRRTALGRFVRRDLQDLVAFAIRLAENPTTPERLNRLRLSLRAHLQRSPACDARRFARAMEQLYHRLAQR